MMTGFGAMLAVWGVLLALLLDGLTDGTPTGRSHATVTEPSTVAHTAGAASGEPRSGGLTEGSQQWV